ncbi:hypothetical protein HDU96_009600 [Phlyctochytrium bullatum]|nr:hypothetical protein HDU96_009600 [Phlyctochytrium bullatum]
MRASVSIPVLLKYYWILAIIMSWVIAVPLAYVKWRMLAFMASRQSGDLISYRDFVAFTNRSEFFVFSSVPTLSCGVYFPMERAELATIEAEMLKQYGPNLGSNNTFSV